MVRREWVGEIDRRLEDTYGRLQCPLHHRTPHELLVAVVLSAQCTDVRVNQVTDSLFRLYPDVNAFADADQVALENAIRPVGFFRHKAAALIGAAGIIREKHGGVVPMTMAELTALPGVGRKTANVVLGDAFGVPGFPVDTHVRRLLNRIGLVDEQDPEKIEAEINRLLPEQYWVNFSHLLITHGRRVCSARNPKCARCVLLDRCKFPDKILS